jgi:G3E family GTPase
VDAADAGARKRSPEIARGQIAAADVVVLSKIDRAGNAEDSREEIRQVNPAAPCLAAKYGEVDAAALLRAKPGTDHVFSASATHGSAIRTFALRFEQPVRRELLQQFLATLVDLRGADLLRVKGIVRLSDDQLVVVQGVRHVFDRLRPAKQGEAALVFVTNGVEKSEVQALWDAMKGLA